MEFNAKTVIWFVVANVAFFLLFEYILSVEALPLGIQDCIDSLTTFLAAAVTLPFTVSSNKFFLKGYSRRTNMLAEIGAIFVSVLALVATCMISPQLENSTFISLLFTIYTIAALFIVEFSIKRYKK